MKHRHLGLRGCHNCGRLWHDLGTQGCSRCELQRAHDEAKREALRDDLPLGEAERAGLRWLKLSDELGKRLPGHGGHRARGSMDLEHAKKHGVL